MSKTFKTIRPYTPPPPEPYRPPKDDGTSFVPMGSYKRVPKNSAVITEALKWWKASLAMNGMGQNPMDPNVSVVEESNWLIFKLDGKREFMVDRNSNDLSIHVNLNATRSGTLLDRIERWKRDCRGIAPSDVADAFRQK